MRALSNTEIQALDALAVKLASLREEVALVRDYALRGDSELLHWRRQRMDNHLREIHAIAQEKLGVDFGVPTRAQVRDERRREAIPQADGDSGDSSQPRYTQPSELQASMERVKAAANGRQG